MASAVPIVENFTEARATPQARRIELDFIRGIAILLAMGWHFNAHDTGNVFVDVMLKPGRMLGWAGVDLFFVLSGFLVGGLIFGEYKKSGDFKARRFLIRRAFKIWPVLYLYIALVVFARRYSWSDVVPQTLFHVQNFFETPLNHLWSLAVEEHFYLIFAAAAYLFLRNQAKIFFVPAFLISVMLVVPILRIAGLLGGVSHHALHIQTQFRVDALACGVFLSYFKTYFPERFSGLVRMKLVWVCAGAAGVAVLILIGSYPDLLVTLGYSISYLSGAFLLLLTYDARPLREGGVSARLIAWIGRYSYPMYVFQFVAYRAGEAAWNRFVHGTMPPLLLLGVQYGGAILVAVAVTKLIEQPSLKFRDYLFPAA